MSNFEKLLVNREGKGRRNATKVHQRLRDLDTASIQDVLEISCGIGTVSAILSETYGFNVTGTDFDPAQIEKARRLYPENDKLRFQIEDGANLPFDIASMDLVIAQNVFHHIPDWRKALAEVHRVLRGGGHLMWLDIFMVTPIRQLLSAIVKGESFLSLDEVVRESGEIGFVEQFNERMPLLLFSQHHFVFQKRQEGFAA